MKVTILASGSSGNLTLVECDGAKLLIDAGISCRRMGIALAACNVSPLELTGIVLSHEHGDHARGIDVWVRKFHTPIYCTQLTAAAMNLNGAAKIVRGSIKVGHSELSLFPIPHDAIDPSGVLVTDKSGSFASIMDAGCITDSIMEHTRYADMIFVEANHEPDLLANDATKPESVRRRIASRHGHLSNQQCATFIEDILNENYCHTFAVGHLSATANHPDAVRAAMPCEVACFSGDKIVLECTTA